MQCIDVVGFGSGISERNGLLLFIEITNTYYSTKLHTRYCRIEISEAIAKEVEWQYTNRDAKKFVVWEIANKSITSPPDASPAI